MTLNLILTREVSGLGHPNTISLVRKAAESALKAEGVAEDCILSVLLTDDEGIRRINREFRELDRPTDVLSFPMNEFVPGAFDAEAGEWDYDDQAVVLGDMVLSLERAHAQGEEFGHGPDREISYLTVHSVLHLLGYDHLDEGEEKRLMREREEYIMQQLGLQAD